MKIDVFFSRFFAYSKGPSMPSHWRDESDNPCLLNGVCCCRSSPTRDVTLQPTLRPWTTGLFDTGGCIDALMCGPCQGSRQMMALAGWEQSVHVGWTVYFLLHYIAPTIVGNGVCLAPPCAYAALQTRVHLVSIERIDENLCSTVVQAVVCSVCSLAQTRRELDAVGVCPGGTVGNAGCVAEMK
ncbi:GPI-anchored surface protein, putative [Bodo saltans]|uniref:GPI-anchored surface protein, putative n=1 Tax=Bodo saltans TaxID=75058 RepID=A0A0S4JBF1_BODSA|nr:GPI-anchored surface protein, putative [Bodo saltans]|eukprot:CUG87695.1 GPI-anchored surface protein, putative [Bodo saltans]